MQVDYIDHMGSDLTVVNAARVSFDKQSDWTTQSYTQDGRDKLNDRDEKLIHYLATHNHWTPFGHPQITLRETVPIFVARQRFKHMVGFVYNEVSRRYVSDLPEFYTPNEWRGAPTNAKQGSEGVVGPVNNTFFEVPGHGDWYYNEYIDFCTNMYNTMIKAGVAPEQGRMVLPQSMYTSYYVTGSLAAYARAYKLRSDEHAQQEIQELAEGWAAAIELLFPVSWSALTSTS